MMVVHHAITTRNETCPYEILAPVGAGGMGEVYKARDTRLGRDVAVKVLPEHLSNDEQALARFEKEAQAVAALTHPNVLGIFDFGRAGSIAYAVMELLDGETLREKLRGGTLSVRRTIEIAIEVAHGLAAAHRKGITHRDLKPENIFLTRDGRAIILDFGLAKRELKSEPAGTNVSTAPRQTGPGTILGTVGYMSPEQVRGQATDYRTDIFSYGLILYEMLSGRQAFWRETISDTMSAILRDDPPELSETGKPIPPALDRIVRHCMEKDPERRFGSAADIAFDLEALSQTSGPSAPQRLQTIRKKFRFQTIALILALLVIPAAFLFGRRTSQVQQPGYHRLTFARGTVHGARFAPDGSTIIYAGAWNGNPYEVFATRADSTGATPLELSNAVVFSISSSGMLAIGLRPEAVGSLYAYTTLAQVPMAGGVPRELLEDVISADWSPRGNALAV